MSDYTYLNMTDYNHESYCDPFGMPIYNNFIEEFGNFPSTSQVNKTYKTNYYRNMNMQGLYNGNYNYDDITPNSNIIGMPWNYIHNWNDVSGNYNYDDYSPLYDTFPPYTVPKIPKIKHTQPKDYINGHISDIGYWIVFSVIIVAILQNK